jgi:hypothetical protein
MSAGGWVVITCCVSSLSSLSWTKLCDATLTILVIQQAGIPSSVSTSTVSDRLEAEHEEFDLGWPPSKIDENIPWLGLTIPAALTHIGRELLRLGSPVCFFARWGKTSPHPTGHLITDIGNLGGRRKQSGGSASCFPSKDPNGTPVPFPLNLGRTDIGPGSPSRNTEHHQCHAACGVSGAPGCQPVNAGLSPGAFSADGSMYGGNLLGFKGRVVPKALVL